MVSTTTAAGNGYFDSTDLYFQPDDPAVMNPHENSPHTRFRSFLGGKRWQNSHARKAGNHHHLHNGHGNVSPTTHRYFFTTSTTSTATASTTPDRFSESLASLARTSASSSEEDEDFEDCKQGDECSLSYSVASSDKHFLVPFEEDDHQYLTASSILKDNKNVYEDTDTGRSSLLFVPPSERDAKVKGKDECFQSWNNGDMECFHPLAWIGNAFQTLIRSVEKQKSDGAKR